MSNKEPKAAIRAIVTGSNGRVGQLLCRMLTDSPAWTVAQAARRGDALVAEADVLIDFTAPEPMAAYATWCANAGVAFVSGSTGLHEGHHDELDRAAQRVPVLWAPNMSRGVNVLLRLAELGARALGDAVDLEVTEVHHRHKKDAPSGTATQLVEALARGRGWADPQARSQHGRQGLVGERPAGEIGVHALRGGDVVGEHTAHFLWEGERLELTHRATDRAIFARGALAAAGWLVSQPPGRYTMADALHL